MNRRQACILLAAAPAAAVDFESRWPRGAARPWIGPEYWANPLQDWRLREGRIECFVPGGDRNVYLLTHEIGGQAGSFDMRVRLGRIASETNQPGGEGFAGFRVGIRGRYNDYRDSAIYGTGVNAGISADGRLFIGRLDAGAPQITQPLDNVELALEAKPTGARYQLRLIARGGNGAVLGEVVSDDIEPAWLTGGVALVCSSAPVEETPNSTSVAVTMSGINKRNAERGGALRCWFRNWRLSGDKVTVHPERAWGPILFAMHTVNRGVMKLTAQLAPIGDTSEPVRLEVRTSSSGAWRRVQAAKIDAASRTATFRIAKWDDTRDVQYRLAFRLDGDHHLEGTIRKDPKDKAKVVVAGLSCVNDLGFPHTEITRAVRHFRPDLLAFTGDQIYERVGGYGIQRGPLETATLDYLRKWYIFGWAFGELMADTPSICMPDDHDVYHGNVWGAGGKAAEGTGQPAQDSGGYQQPAQWVNMVQRTQTSHMPDPYDPTPVNQGIGVYYCSLLLGGVSFAIIEDRKWKSAPKTVLPNAQIVNGWARNPEYNAPKDGDAPGAQLLGERQIQFLNDWAADWTGGAWMKAVFSQTIFTNLATLPKPANTDAVTPKLPTLPPGGHGEDELRVADHDSNGWPQSPRNEALRAIRRALAFHIAGDQHLGSTVQYGIDEWNDAAWAVCVPAVANIFPRRWYPAQPGRSPKPHSPRNTGEFLDGFGNKMTVHAVLNPQAVDIEPKEINHRAPGYGIIEFSRDTRQITVANWPRWIDPSKPGAKPAPGWPITIDQTANGLPQRGWTLKAVDERAGSVIQVVDQDSSEVLYTYRVPTDSFAPSVFKQGNYSVKVLDDNGKVKRTIRDLKAAFVK